MEINSLSMMVGKTIIETTPVEKGVEHFGFRMDDGAVYVFYHDQDCCESVEVEDVCGEISDLIGSSLLQAEEVTSTDARPKDPFTGEQCDLEYEDSQTWTFYKFATIKGSVTIRWLGQSNGCYSEGVTLETFKAGEEIHKWALFEPPKSLASK